ncbi:MAG: GMC family oxidoreductase N-terminal domain-containing protein, partial [bacterium]
GALERRTYISHRFRKATIPLFRDVAKLKQLFYLGYYGDARAQKKIGFEPVPERQRYKEKPPVGRNLPDIKMYFPDGHVIETEICVVGSGAGGAVVANQLAQRGHEVTILEAGPYMRTKDIKHDEISMTRKLYKDGGLQTTIDFDMTIFQGRCLGGSTLINNAICINLFENNPALLDRWQEMGATIDSSELQASFARVGKMLSIAEIKPEIAGENARILFDGVAAIDPNKDAKYFEKNYKFCYGCGYCNWGCPYDRKLSMLETYLPQAVKDFGAKIISNCQALEIQKDGRRARGVRCEYNGRELFIKADKMVVSCGTVASSLLLLNSGFTRNAGKYVSFNAAAPVIALFNREIRGYDGVQMASYIQMDGYLFETWFNPPMTQAVSLAGWFEEHFELMENYRKMGSIGIAMGTESNAEVVRSALVRNLLGPVKYKMSARDLAKMKEAIVNLARLYFAAGALKVYPPTFNASPITRADFEDNRITDIIDARLKKPDDFYFSTAHPQGGNIINASPEKGVIDNNFKVHGSDNIYVCDASVFPTTVGINPQWTIMAMADYAAPRISGK